MFPIITNPVQFKLSSKLKKNTEEAKKNAFSFFDWYPKWLFLLYLKGKTLPSWGYRSRAPFFFNKTFDLPSSLTVYDVHIKIWILLSKLWDSPQQRCPQHIT